MGIISRVYIEIRMQISEWVMGARRACVIARHSKIIIDSTGYMLKDNLFDRLFFMPSLRRYNFHRLAWQTRFFRIGTKTIQSHHCCLYAAVDSSDYLSINHVAGIKFHSIHRSYVHIGIRSLRAVLQSGTC